MQKICSEALFQSAAVQCCILLILSSLAAVFSGLMVLYTACIGLKRSYTGAILPSLLVLLKQHDII